MALGPLNRGVVLVGLTVLFASCSGASSSHAVSNSTSKRSTTSGETHSKTGTVVGAIVFAGGPGFRKVKLGGVITVFNHQGAVFSRHVGKGHIFRIALRAGRYRLNFGRRPESSGGCEPTHATVQAGRTTHADVKVGCNIP
jgi:hypothetical protein